MDMFNIICGVCSVLGLLVSIFTANKVIKISQNIICDTQDDCSKVINKGNRNTYHGPYIGRDNINGTRSDEQK